MCPFDALYQNFPKANFHSQSPSRLQSNGTANKVLAHVLQVGMNKVI